MITDTDILYESRLEGLPLVHRGKVRDVYAAGDEHLLIVATDRLSAFDVVLPDPIPGKGAVLTSLSNFWFARTSQIVPNHLTDLPLETFLDDPEERDRVRGRAVVVRRLKGLPVEAIARGFLIGSGWKDYQRSGEVCGIRLPEGLPLAGELPSPIFTPSTKAEGGAHDENIGFGAVEQLLGGDLAREVRQATLAIYEAGAAYAAQRGILVADTKLEFGLDQAGRLILMDELLTPDSSRFWPADQWRPGENPPSFDKQFVRDYLETLDWDKTPPGPSLPKDIIEQTARRYNEAYRRLVE